MPQSLLFIPDISGFTNFVQTTEVEHSQHVIAELLELLIASNTQKMHLAEVEGDALFFYKENDIPSQEKILAQIETMFTAFYGHLQLLEKNKICPCNACATAPQLELKIVAHCGKIQYLSVQGKKKPFGEAVIETHRLLKNNIPSDNYVIISNQLASELRMPLNYTSKLFTFIEESEHYDTKEIQFIYSKIDNALLKILPYERPKIVKFNREPNLIFSKDITITANQLLEIITNFKYREKWIEGVDKFEYNTTEVTRLGTEHVCVINGTHFNFTTVTKEVSDTELVYGELTTSPIIFDELYQFYSIAQKANNTCTITAEVYWTAKSPFKKLLIHLFAKRQFKKNGQSSLINLKAFTERNFAAKK